MTDFISEDDLATFEGWLKFQHFDATTLTSDQLATCRRLFDEGRKANKVGLMKLQPVPGEYRYAIALRDSSGLWLTLWVRRSRKGEFFVMLPRADREWDPHASYHLDGTFHNKSHGQAFLPQKRQPLTGMFKGTESLGAYGGHGPKSVGAVCDPAVFTGVVEVPPGVLGPRDGTVVIDLVEPGCEPLAWPGNEVMRQTFRDTVPWVVIRIIS